MTNKTVEFLIQEYGPLISHINLTNLLKKPSADAFRKTLERSTDHNSNIINRARRDIGRRTYYSIEMLAPLFSSENEGGML